MCLREFRGHVPRRPWRAARAGRSGRFVGERSGEARRAEPDSCGRRDRLRTFGPARRLVCRTPALQLDPTCSSLRHPWRAWGPLPPDLQESTDHSSPGGNGLPRAGGSHFKSRNGLPAPGEATSRVETGSPVPGEATSRVETASPTPGEPTSRPETTPRAGAKPLQDARDAPRGSIG